MLSIRALVVAMCLCLATFSGLAYSQFGGSRAGVRERSDLEESNGKLAPLTLQAAQAYITLEGTAEIRVRPTQIRIVLAVTSVAETAQLCRQEVNEKIKKLRAEWKKLGLGDEKVVEDFIAVLPRFEWKSDMLEDREVLVERKIGYRMQSNMHVSVANDQEADAAINRAFDVGVTDIIAFDYGSSGLDAAKENALSAALKAAKSKAEKLLSGVIKGEPEIINVQEQTSVHYPQSLYKSFTNVDSDELITGWRENIPRIHAHRPTNTYYRGLVQNADVQPRDLPMQSEISVVSTVRLYFTSPAASKKIQPATR